MGGHTNYSSLIYTLVLLKHEYSRISKAKFLPLLHMLEEYSVIPDREDDHLPDHKKIAEKLQYTVPRTCKLLKDLHRELLKTFDYKPLKIKNYRHEVVIHIPYDEQEELKLKNKNHPLLNEYTWIELELPVTPRIGDTINLDFLHLHRFKRGYVHNVEHRIDGVNQSILVEVHPYNNGYERWKKMQEESIRIERITRQFENNRNHP